MHSSELTTFITELKLRISELERLSEIDTPEKIDRSIIRHMARTADFLNKGAIAVAVDAVRHERISKRAAADNLHIHPNTLERWIQRFEELYDRSVTTPVDADIIDKLG